MKAARIHSYGESDVLVYEDAPRPNPNAGELLVRVYATTVNPIDWKLRAGYMRSFMDFPMPITLGCDLAGIVESVGTGVTKFKVGDAIYGMPQAEIGMYAEYAVVSESDVAAKPNSLDFIAAASVPVAALTAWQSLFEVGNLAPGQTVLIHGAAGGVGSMAVQLAKTKGSQVIGTASANNHEFLRGLGADEVIDYKTTRFEDVVKDVDIVLDLIGGETRERSWQVIKKGGSLVSTVPPFPSDKDGANYSVYGKGIAVQPNAEQLKAIATLIDTGKLKPLVDKVLPLSQVRQAHELSQSGHVRGKIALQVR
ncbi:NADP-dependent oxidoreductase [Nostoc sp. FACHB-110]|nr:NADP-dependent oxidoreductase [Nostoc sp. FACHB-110]